jgi:carbon storage regulator
MINDNIVITVVEVKNGQCKIAIEADRDVKIYREEIYYQVKLANLVGKNTNLDLVDSVDSLLKNDKIKLNDSTTAIHEDAGFEIDKSKSSKSIIINKQNNNKDI